MAKKNNFWNSTTSKYGTYEDGEKGNPEQWKNSFKQAFANSDSTKSIISKSNFEILGIEPTTSFDKVKKKFYQLAKIHHPEKGGDNETFLKIIEAYNAIKKSLEIEQIIDQDDLILPQLLSSIDEDELEKYLLDDDFGCQEKKDGRHLTLQTKNNDLIIRNKKGQKSKIVSVEIKHSIMKINSDVLIDGEIIKDKFYTWDILELDGNDLRNKSYIERFYHLKSLHFGSSIIILDLINDKKEKLDLFKRLKEYEKEGIVFKRLNAKYKSGKGLDQFKYKFYNECSVIVTKGRDNKSSIGIELIGPNGREFVGYCGCNKDIAIGSIVDIKYLYAYKEGCLYQPIFLKIRNDVSIEECTTSQLKYKKD
jgi:bifunctional non-homologous end joining protein LigD